MARTRLHIPTALIAAMATAAVVNVAGFPAIETRMSTQYEAFSAYPGSGLLDLVENHFASTQGRFLVYAQLRDLAPGATLIIPPGTGLTEEHLRGLAAASQVHIREYEPDVSAEVAASLLTASVAEGEDRRLGHYVIAIEPNPTELVLVRRGDVTILADIRLVHELPAAARG